MYDFGYMIGSVIGFLIVTSIFWVPLVIWGRRKHRKFLQARAEARATLARAEYEHSQFMDGNYEVGMYGQFPPANT
ncbi:hypothetical protein SEA_CHARGERPOWER_37 [Mycobacterium phage Chargerpower]|nr:hypothetical protein SEA_CHARGERPOWER_37 [Mycobacterium phage Chargerpower]